MFDEERGGADWGSLSLSGYDSADDDAVPALADTIGWRRRFWFESPVAGELESERERERVGRWDELIRLSSKV